MGILGNRPYLAIPSIPCLVFVAFTINAVPAVFEATSQVPHPASSLAPCSVAPALQVMTLILIQAQVRAGLEPGDLA